MGIGKQGQAFTNLKLQMHRPPAATINHKKNSPDPARSTISSLLRTVRALLMLPVPIPVPIPVLWLPGTPPIPDSAPSRPLCSMVRVKTVWERLDVAFGRVRVIAVGVRGRVRGWG